MTPASDSEIDAEVLRQCTSRQAKVLRIEWTAREALEARGLSCGFDRLAQSVPRLVASGHIKVFGDLSRPHYCEIALA